MKIKFFCDYLDKFGLYSKRKIKTFSKGMKKQLSIIIGICSGLLGVFIGWLLTFPANTIIEALTLNGINNNEINNIIVKTR